MPQILASSGSSLKLWNTENFQLIQDVHNNSNDISNFTWNKDGNFLATLDRKSSEVSLYSVSSSTAVCSGVLHMMDELECIQFCNTTNYYLAAGGSKESLLIWDMKNNAKKKSFEITKGGISTLSFSCSDSHIAVGTGAGDAYLLSNTNNLVTGPVKMFSEKARITDIRYGSLSQTLIGSCSDNGSFALMDANARKVLKEFPHAHTAPASALAFSPINDLLAVTVGYDKKFITYNANSKSIITSQKTSDPLTSVCFLNCGQSLVLGTMNGNILVYDLRVFSSPKMCFSADSGPILDLQIQPKATSSSGGASVRSTSKSKTASQKEFLQNKGKKREVIRTEKLDLDLAMAGSKTFSPPPQCLSPIKRQTFQQDTTIVKNTPLLKTLAKTSRRTGLSVDEMGILSPLDKENKSPFYRNQPSPSPRRRSSLKPALIVEGLLSPIETSRSNNSSCVTSSPNQSHSEYSIDATIESGAAPKKEGSIISGEVLSLLGGDYGVETKIETISSRAPQDTMVVDLSDCTGDNTPRNNTTSVDVEKNVINREQLNVESVRRNLSLERNVKITVVETPVAPLSSSSVVSIADAQLKSRENVFHSLIRDRFDHSCLQTNGQLHAAPSEMGTISTEGAPTSSVNKSSDETPLKDTSPNFEIAFPAPKSTSDLPTSSESNVSQRNCTESSSSSSDASHLNLQLVKNIVCEALERQQFDINKRFMHLHYTIVKHFFNLRKEMKDLIKETSLREEILTENQRLREEIDRLKCTY